MPDGTEQKNKNPSSPSTAEKTGAATETDFSPRRGPPKALRLAVIGAILAVAVFFAARETFNRSNFVYTEDSRVEADLITVSSRVAGWVTSIEITEGSRISTGAVLLTIDSRESLLRVAELEARISGIEAERKRRGVPDGELSILKYRKAELNAKLDFQKLDLSDRAIKSPVDGVVDRTFVKPGEYVTPGQRLALVHDPRKIWIGANIKETQISKLKIGQRVELTIDAYPDIPFEGRIVSIGNATTSEFALLPSPNPSGNFTKITQRLPVRIAIQQKDGLLRPGMMVEVNIDIRNP